MTVFEHTEQLYANWCENNGIPYNGISSIDYDLVKMVERYEGCMIELKGSTLYASLQIAALIFTFWETQYEKERAEIG